MAIARKYYPARKSFNANEENQNIPGPRPGNPPSPQPKPDPDLISYTDGSKKQPTAIDGIKTIPEAYGLPMPEKRKSWWVRFINWEPGRKV